MNSFILNQIDTGIMIVKVQDIKNPGSMIIEFANKKAIQIAKNDKMIGKTLSEGFPDFAKKYEEVYLTNITEFEYGNENIFQVKAFPMENDKIFIYYYNITIYKY